MKRRRHENRIRPLPRKDEGFSPRRGLLIFLLTLFVGGPLLVGMGLYGSSSLSLTSALLMIVLLAVVAGIIGLWTDKIPF